MAPRPWRSKPSPRVDPTRANGEHEACARAPDGAGGGGRAYRRAYRRMKGTRAGALWTHSDACVGRSPHNITIQGALLARLSVRRGACFGGVVYVKCSGARTERNLLTGRRTLEERCVATPHARRPQARHGRRILTRVRTHRRDTGRESTRSSTRGAGGAVPGGRSVEREPGTRAPGVDPGDARAERAPAARGSSGLGTLHAPARALASRVTRVRTWCLPPPARRDPRPLNRFERKRRGTHGAARGGGGRSGRGGGRETVPRRACAGRPRRSRSSGPAPRVRPRACTKKIHDAAAAAAPARAQRGAHRDRGPGREDARLSER